MNGPLSLLCTIGVLCFIRIHLVIQPVKIKMGMKSRIRFFIQQGQRIKILAPEIKDYRTTVLQTIIIIYYEADEL
jgi:hypothetical protein